MAKDLSKKDTKRIIKGLDPIEAEDDAQIRFVKYLAKKLISGEILEYTAIPNSTRTPYKKILVKNKKMGLRKGLPDIFLIYRAPDLKDRCAFVEMKREQGGTVSKEQRRWINALKNVEGMKVTVAK